MSSNPRIDRRSFVAALRSHIPQALIIAGLGSSAYDLFAAGDSPRNYYLWGAMGGAVPMGLGLALARPTESVVVLTGDGEQLMGIGSLATVAAKRPPNLSIIVLDNGHFGETGMQKSHTSLGADLVAVARAVGLTDCFKVGEAGQIQSIADKVNARAGTVFAQVLIEASEVPKALPPRDGGYLGNRFRAALGLAPL